MLLDAPLRSGPCRASYCAPPRQTPAPPNNRPGARSFLFFAEIVPVRNFLIEPRGFPVAPARLRLSRCFRQHPNCEGCHYWPGDMVWIPTNPLSYRTFPESGTRHKKSIGYLSAIADALFVGTPDESVSQPVEVYHFISRSLPGLLRHFNVGRRQRR